MKNDSKDLEIIKRIEKVIDRELKEYTTAELIEYGPIRHGYRMNENRRVTGLRVDYYATHNSNLIPFIRTLHNLEILVLMGLSNTPIPSLKELGKLKMLHIRGTKLKDYTFLKELKGLSLLSIKSNDTSP
ncbi:MAG: hypothetical protein GY757_58180, partial [bacterium]|nr:hypothetical protein [bacterium]